MWQCRLFYDTTAGGFDTLQGVCTMSIMTLQVEVFDTLQGV